MTDVLVVDRKGLARKLGKKPKSFIVFELLQNAWDEKITRVNVSMEMLPGRPACKIVVEDDCPEGFQDLTSVYTMFKDSKKSHDPEKRGRFELGEKLVLALALEAEVISTKGSVLIKNDERTHSRKKLEKGTIFLGTFKMTREEYEEVERDIRQVIPPAGIKTIFNGTELPVRTPLHTFETTLQTIRADEEGQLSPTQRKTVVEVYEVREGETAHIYEMGLPVVETSDKWHYNILQRVPVNWERNNVPPSYKKTLRVEVLNAMHSRLSKDEAAAPWVADAAEDPRAEAEAIKDIVVKRFGEKSVIYDPSDPEGSKLAMSQGYTVIPGGTLSKGTWDNIRRFSTVLPAGQVTPSPKCYDPEGRPENVIDPTEWTADMTKKVVFAKKLFTKLTPYPECSVRIVKEPTSWWVANFGNGALCLNYSKLGKAWFALPNRAERVLNLLVHEFGHAFCSDHLSEKYHDALTDMAAKLCNLALDDPSFFES
jgi:hypothetical protein